MAMEQRAVDAALEWAVAKDTTMDERLDLRDVLNELSKAIARGEIHRCAATATALLARGVTDVGVLEGLAEKLGVVDPERASGFARIAATIAPGRPRALVILSQFHAPFCPLARARLAAYAVCCEPTNLGYLRWAALAAGKADDPRGSLSHLMASFRLAPYSGIAWLDVAKLRLRLGEVGLAGRSVMRALVLVPDMVTGWDARAQAMTVYRRREDTIQSFRRGVVSDTANPAIQRGLGDALRRAGDLKGAANAFRRSLTSRPNQAPSLSALGQFLVAARDAEHARAVTVWARIVDPENAEAQFFSALADLRLGALKQGWARYDWHRNLEFPKGPRTVKLPKWTGGEPEPYGVVVENDQVGLGEEIMYLGALSDFAALAPVCKVVCSPKISSLVARSFPDLMVTGEWPGNVSTGASDARLVVAPLISVVQETRRSLNEFPAHVGYLAADPDRVAVLRARYNNGRPLVGLSWTSPRGFQGPDKSIPLALWAPVFETLDARFVSLQYEADEAEVNDARVRFEVDIVTDRDLDIFGDVDLHAAQIAAMDRVISISSIVAHLAGALGRPVDMLYPSEIALLWYWFDGRTDSPWYPSMRIHRPPEGGDKQALMERFAADLATLSIDGKGPASGVC